MRKNIDYSIEALAPVVAAHATYREIADHLGLSPKSSLGHMKRRISELGIDTGHLWARGVERYGKYTKDILEPVIANNVTMSGVLRDLGLKTTTGGSFRQIKSKIEEYGLDTSHFTGRNPDKPGGITVTPLEDILVENSKYSRYHLKRRLLKVGLLENTCSKCGLDGTWQGAPIVMVLDHINGVNNDNRLNNLRMLCPNCNSQEPTFAGKNNKKNTEGATSEDFLLKEEIGEL
jgi:hypothetical protein